MGRTLIMIGLAIVAIGLLWPWLTRLSLGRLPGDIYIQGESGSLYFRRHSAAAGVSNCRRASRA